MDTWLAVALPAAVAYASSLLGDRARGEDVVQDCVCRLLQHAERYDLERDGRKLLFRAISNACINQQTRQREVRSLNQAGQGNGEVGWEVEDRFASTPLQVVLTKELREAILTGLQTLPLAQRSVLELSSLGHGAEEIAEMLSLRLDHIRVLLHRARRAMAKYLNERFSERLVP